VHCRIIKSRILYSSIHNSFEFALKCCTRIPTYIYIYMIYTRTVRIICASRGPHAYLGILPMGSAGQFNFLNGPEYVNVRTYATHARREANIKREREGRHRTRGITAFTVKSFMKNPRREYYYGGVYG